MKVQATRQDAYDLIHQGILTFADIEQNGIPIHVEYCEDQLDVDLEGSISSELRETRARLKQYDEIKMWKRVYGPKFNIDSGTQLADVLFEHLGLEAKKFTEKGELASTAREDLKHIDLPFLKDYHRAKKLKSAQDRLQGILRETVDGLMHPFFELHKAVTYRSSSEAYNFQNNDVRDKEKAKLIREAIIPSPGNQIGELDFKGAEVCVSACNNHDPALIADILDDSKDMHRDMAMKVFCLTLEQLGRVDIQPGKNIRYCGKNKMVFPQFYGDFYGDCARELWESILSMSLTTAQGIGLYEHLAKQTRKIEFPTDFDKDGRPIKWEARKAKIDNYESFMYWVRMVEREFWDVDFKVYKKWKYDFYNEYCKKGYFDTFTGFRCSGFMKRNEVCNYPVQGPSFHCLLWYLIELQKEMLAYKFKSKIMGQIHDSAVFNFHPPEIDDILGLTHEIIDEDLPEHWPWLEVPMSVEFELAPVDKSWFHKKECADKGWQGGHGGELNVA